MSDHEMVRLAGPNWVGLGPADPYRQWRREQMADVERRILAGKLRPGESVADLVRYRTVLVSDMAAEVAASSGVLPCIEEKPDAEVIGEDLLKEMVGVLEEIRDTLRAMNERLP